MYALQCSENQCMQLDMDVWCAELNQPHKIQTRHYWNILGRELAS